MLIYCFLGNYVIKYMTERNDFGKGEAAMKFNLFKKSEKDQIEKRYEADPLNPDNALDYLLFSLSKELTGIENIIENKSIYCPEIDLTVTPVIGELTPRSAFLEFYLYCPKWGKALYECSAGSGNEPSNALGMASGSFLFTFMNVILKMELEADTQMTERFSAEFSGNIHNWRVYLSDVVGLGSCPKVDSPRFYWDLLKEEIVKRLGNQKLCYVKVYGAKTAREAIGECRVDDVKSDELSEIVAREVEKWDVESFASHKMFFFIRQEDSTVTPYPYWGREGEALLAEKVKTAAILFQKVNSEEEYNALTENLTAALGDATLAQECFSFLPEICAEHAFEEMRCSEKFDISAAGKETVTCYKNQLSDYHRIGNALFRLFGSGFFGDKTNELYRQYISTSATGSLVSQALEKGTDIKTLRPAALIYQVGEDFEIR